MIKARSFILIPLAVLLIALIIFAPLPVKVTRQLDALAYSDDAEPVRCQIEISGWVLNYLFKADEFSGRMAVSINERTCADKTTLYCGIGKGQLGQMAYHDGSEYFTPGYFIARKNLSWYYAHMKDGSGASYEIVAPSEMTPEEARDKALALARLDALP